METNGKTTFGSTLKADVTSAPDATGAISTESLSGNEALKAKYDEMHRQGPSAWFNDGKEERELILKMGEPWEDVNVLEIGCGEGELAKMMYDKGAHVVGLDYSDIAMEKAKRRWGMYGEDGKYVPIESYWGPLAAETSWDNPDFRGDSFFGGRIVMQGVLEHLDDPFGSLQAMVEKFKPKSIITSSPCFLNPRGIVWMTLHMLGAVMSKTDLHFLHPWQFGDFCEKHGYKLSRKDCDWDWGHWQGMIEDLRQRIPLALRDGNIAFEQKRLDVLLTWLSRFELGSIGATMVYRIDL